MTWIGVDIDDSLYSFGDMAREACFKLYEETGDYAYKMASYHFSAEWRSFPDIMGGPVIGLEKWMRAIQVCHTEHGILSRTPFEGAVETCQALLKEGHNLLYISNRNPDSAEWTKQWLNDYGFLDTDNGMVDVKCLHESKKPYLTRCQYLIDDRPKTAVEFAYDHDWFHDHEYLRPGTERKVFMKSYSYNQNLTDVPRLFLAPTWRGLARFMVKEGLLEENPVKAVAIH